MKVLGHVALGLAVACGGQVSSTTPYDAGPPCASEGDASLEAGAVPVSFDAAQVTKARGVCDAPHGPAYAPTSYVDTVSHLIGGWYFCSATSSAGAVPPQTSGFPLQSVVLSPDGSATFLVPDAQVGLVAGQGLFAQGYYLISTFCDGLVVCESAACGESESFAATLVPPVYTDGLIDVSFEQAPTRMEIQEETGTETWTFWYVPLGGS
jgi:hypothetical protein